MRTELRILAFGIAVLQAALAQAQLDPAPGQMPAPAPPPAPVEQAPVYSPTPVEYAAPPPPSEAPESTEWRARDASLVISAERLMGLHLSFTSREAATSDYSSTQLQLSLLWNTQGSVSPYAVPYIGIHGIVGPGLTIGGNIGFYVTSGSEERSTATGSTELDFPTRTGFILAPRFGCLLSAGRVLSFWIRGGFSFYGARASQDDDLGTGTVVFEYSEYGFALSLDPMLVIAPVEHAAIMLGPVLDLGLWGTIDSDIDAGVGGFETDDPSLRITNLGLVAGVAIFL